jgi:hypothetical protein
MDVSRLSSWQRIKRRLALLRGHYAHPDGHIELDFEGPAGIDRRNDSSELQAAKLAAYEKRQAASAAQVRLFVLGVLVGAALIHYKPSLWPF